MRTAIIAVHGVGSPDRNATARAIADLLVKHGAEGGEYSEFRETCLTLPVDPLVVEPSPEKRTGGLGGLLIGNRDRTRLIAPPTKATNAANAAKAPEPPDVAFMRNQLQGYQSANEPFDTIELVGQRRSPGATPPRDVHVFEMYWADLSRIGSGAARVFGAVFQLIQHISHLGRKALDVASQVASGTLPADDAEARALRAYAYAHALVVRLFTIFVPVSTLLMLSCVALFVPAAVDAAHRLLAGLIAAVLLVLVVAGVLSFRGSRSERAVSGFVWLMIGVVVVGGVVYALLRGGGDVLGTVLLTAVIGALTVASYLAVLRGYDRNREGAFAWGVLLLVAVAVLTLVSTLRTAPVPDPAENVRRVAFLGFQWSFLALVLSWGMLWVSTIVAFGIYMAMVRPAVRERAAQRARVTRAAWTARVTLAGSIFSFIIVALVAYGAIVYLAAKAHSHVDLFPHATPAHPLPRVTAAIAARDSTCFAPDSTRKVDPSSCGIRFFQSLVATGGTSGLVVALGGAAVSLLLVSWFFALIAYTALRDLAQVKSRALGDWMTGGFRWMTHAGTLFAFTTLSAIIVGATLDTLRLRGVITAPPGSWLGRVFSPDATQGLLNTLTVALVASAATVAAFRARLDALATKAKPILGILLDVDNYLRESPYEGTPRARIAERYVSLLRHVLRRTNADGSPYFDCVVIASHSQGTVISADLLRFLRITGLEPGLVDKRVRLLTMGSPLRQLYAQHFPHLYEWIDRSDDAPGVDDDTTAGAALGLASLHRTPGELTGRSPSPLWLGVGEWVNLFTTGDYVGRTLWRTEVSSTWTPQTETTASLGYRRRERCLGSGTHTHYWTAGAVAEELDRLIAAGAEHPSPGRPAEHTPAPR